METSLGIFETKGFASAIAAAQIILNENSFELLSIQKTGGGIVSLFFKGEENKLKASFETGILNAKLIGKVVSTQIISQPNDTIMKMLFPAMQAANKSTSEQILNKELNIIGNREALITKTKIEKSPAEVTEVKKEKIPKKFDLAKTSFTLQRLRNEALFAQKSVGAVEETTKTKSRKKTVQINVNKIENLNVHEMRRLARSTKGFPIQGREISKANRKELLLYFKDMG